MGTKVLVTGGCGFIGSHIVEELIYQQYEVIVVDNLSTGKIENISFFKDKIIFEYADVNSEHFLKIVKNHLPKYIIHPAAQIDVNLSINDITFDASQNIMASLRVIEAASRCGVEKIIFASSAAVYGNPIYLPVDNAHPISPISPYGLSKNTVERYLEMAFNLYGLKYTILRYSNVYGPRQNGSKESGIINIFINKLLKNEQPVIFGDGKQTRDFVYVKDVARANVAAIHKGDLKIINICTNIETTINDLFRLLCTLFMMNLVPLYQCERPGDIRHSVLCNKNMIETLNIEEMHSLHDGLVETVGKYK